MISCWRFWWWWWWWWWLWHGGGWYWCRNARRVSLTKTLSSTSTLNSFLKAVRHTHVLRLLTAFTVVSATLYFIVDFCRPGVVFALITLFVWLLAYLRRLPENSVEKIWKLTLTPTPDLIRIWDFLPGGEDTSSGVITVTVFNCAE